MSLPNTTGAVIATGFNCQVRVGSSAADAASIAMVASFQANEDFQVQDAVCLGTLGPISVDPQGYTCALSLDGFLPSKRTITAQQYPGGGAAAIMNHVPERARIMDTGSVYKIAYLDFSNRRDNTVLAAFTGVIVTSNGVNADGNAYVRNNVEMRALSWNKS